jgi:signal transduction histidine kinase
MERQAKASDVTLRVEVDERVPRFVSVDAAKIAWVATALVGNALRYVRRGSRTIPGGSIDMRVTYRSGDPEVTIEIQDDGPGMPAGKGESGQQPRLGFGLSMVRDVVVAHGGSMEIHSKGNAFNSGTTIRITLPVA